MGNVASTVVGAVSLAPDPTTGLGFVSAAPFNIEGSLNLFSGIITDPQGTVTAQINFATGAVTNPQGFITHIYDGANSQIVGFYDDAYGSVLDPQGKIKGYWSEDEGYFDIAGQAAAATVIGVGNLVRALLEEFEGIITDFVDLSFGWVFDPIYAALPPVFQDLGDIYSFIIDTLESLADDIPDIITSLQQVQNVVDSVFTSLPGIIQQLVDIAADLDQYFLDIFNFLLDLPGQIVDFLIDVIRLITGLTSSSVNTLNAATASLNQLVTQATAAAYENADAIIQQTFAVYELAVTSLREILRLSLDSIQAALEYIGPQFNALLEIFLAELRTLVTTGIDEIKKIDTGVARDISTIKMLLGASTFGGTILAFAAKDLVTTA